MEKRECNDAVNSENFNYEDNTSMNNSVDEYLNMIGKYQPLKEEEEKELFRKIKILRGKINIVYFDDDGNICFYNILDILEKSSIREIDKIKKIIPYMSEEDSMIARDFISLHSFNAKENDDINLQLDMINSFFEMREKIIMANLKLVVFVAKKIVTSDTPLLDVIQTGNECLINIFNKFDVDMGYKFSSYAVPALQFSINRSLLYNDKLVRCSGKMQEDIVLYKKIEREYETLYGEDIPVELLLDRLGWTREKLEKVRYAMEACSPLCSLDVHIDDKNEETVKDFIRDEKCDVYETVNNIETKRIIYEEIDKLLSKREKQILGYRFGLFGYEEKTCMEIMNILHISNQRVSQIAGRCIKKLKRSKLINSIVY